MKRKNVFLSISVIILTITAVAAPKGIKRLQPFYYYLKGSTCVYVPMPVQCSPGGVGCTTNEGYQTYLSRTPAGICITPLQPD